VRRSVISERSKLNVDNRLNSKRFIFTSAYVYRKDTDWEPSEPKFSLFSPDKYGVPRYSHAIYSSLPFEAASFLELTNWLF